VISSQAKEKSPLRTSCKLNKPASLQSHRLIALNTAKRNVRMMRNATQINALISDVQVQLKDKHATTLKRFFAIKNSRAMISNARSSSILNNLA